MKIMILGAGVMGTATSWPLTTMVMKCIWLALTLYKSIIQSCKENGYHPRLKRYLPKNVTPYYIEEIETAITGVDFIVSGVNSMGVRWTGQKLAPLLKPGDKVIGIRQDGSDPGR